MTDGGASEAKLICPRSPMAEAAALNPVQRGFDPRRGYSVVGSLQSTTMDPRFEEEPDEDPDEPEPQPNQPDGARGTAAGLVPAVGLPSREWEYSTKVLSVAQVADGVTVVKLLHEAAADGWELASVMDGGEKRVILMRRPKRSARESRRVGFAPPIRTHQRASQALCARRNRGRPRRDIEHRCAPDRQRRPPRQGRRGRDHADDDRVQPARRARRQPRTSADARAAAGQGVGLPARPRRSLCGSARAAAPPQAVRAPGNRGEPGGCAGARLPAVGQGRLTEQVALFGPAGPELRIVEDLVRKIVARDPPEVGRPMTELLEAGGKRIRPALVLLAAMCGKYDPGHAVSAAMAVEVTHAATLVHDDVIDRSPTRRGRPTVAAALGAEPAIVVGDYYFAKAYEQAALTEEPAVVAVIAGAVMWICRGELAQHGARYRYGISVEEYLARIQGKTATLLAASAWIGGRLAGLEKPAQSSLHAYGTELGLAFQI